ncbi:MAG: class I SAM-dependent methyltransferase [Candidatus Kapabacteria bacterium]|nr:class I SAM-dependent methyltransferase [Candidatus Kapabacteria bacterium]
MSTPWFATWFESPWYMRLYRHRTQEEAQKAVHLVRSVANIKTGARVLDVCCGYGRHAHALADAGYLVTGLDASIYLIDRAREVYPHDHVTYVIGDMRGPYPDAPYDAIVNFFTSYGYFDTDAENASVPAMMARSLVAGGTVVLDFLNAHRVRSTLVPETVSLIDGVTVVQERWIDEPFVRKRITITNPCSHDVEYEERVWLYDADDLRRHCKEAGLVVTDIYGDYDGSPLDRLESPRCIVLARR